MSQSEIAEYVYNSDTSPYERDPLTAEQLNARRLKNLASNVVVTDVTDADGLGCGALYVHEFDNVSILFAGHNSPDQPAVLETLQKTFSVADDSLEQLFITDLGQNSEDSQQWKTLVDDFATLGACVRFRDHHRTPPELKNSLKERENVDYQWAPDKEKCATELVWEHDVTSKPQRLHELVELTSVIDLRKTGSEHFERARELKDASSWLGPAEYIAAAVDHGADLTRNGEIGEYLAQRRGLRDKKIDFVVKRAETTTVNGVNVALAVGDCYQTRVAEQIFNENAEIDLVAVIKPTGKVSFRSRKGTSLARDIAVVLGGGGHATEAGARYHGPPLTPVAPEAKAWILEGIREL